MNRNRREELLTRWMDGDLGQDELRELEPLLARHPELERERDEYARIRAGLKEALSAHREPPYPDFFNSHLQGKVRDAMRRASADSPAGGRWGRWFGWWFAPAATAVVVMAFLAGMKIGRPIEVAGPVVPAAMPPAVYSPISQVHAEARLDADLDATVIVLSGLDDLADQALSINTGGGLVPAGHYVVSFTGTGSL